MASVNRSPVNLSGLSGQITGTVAAAGTQNGADQVVGTLTELALDINVSAIAGTSPTLTFSLQRKGLDGNYYTIWSGTAITAIGVQSQTFGAGCETAKSFGNIVRLVCVAGGTTPTATFTASLQGK